jgi:AcrR family transcriptional regulator
VRLQCGTAAGREVFVVFVKAFQNATASGENGCAQAVIVRFTCLARGSAWLSVRGACGHDDSGCEKVDTKHRTLYQYFPNRDSILDALIAREREGSERRIRAALAQVNSGEIANTVRAIVRILINSFTRHGRMRKRFALSIMRLAIARGTQTRLDLVVGSILAAWHNSADADRNLNDSEAFVLSCAVLGTLRAAVLEDSPLLKTQAFEDAVVRLILGFLSNPTAL